MGRGKDIRLILALAVAAALWFVMFSPWTRDGVNFWLLMSLSAIALSAFALTGRRVWRDEFRLDASSAAMSVAIAAALWLAFWTGDKVADVLFDFSRPQIAAIYGLRDGFSAWGVGLALLFLIGPAEEIFWRGYVQHALSQRHGRWRGFAIATLIYTLVHLWSFNLMLLLSALVAGAAWGLLYYFFPRRLSAIIMSHALWDCAVFVVFPIE